MLRKYPLCLLSLARLSLPDAKLLKLKIAYASLRPAVWDLVRFAYTVLLAENLVADCVLRVAGKEVVLLLCHDFLHGLVHFSKFAARCV